MFSDGVLFLSSNVSRFQKHFFVKAKGNDVRKSFVCGVFIQDRCVLAMKIINANVKERTLALCLFRFCSKCVNHGKN